VRAGFQKKSQKTPQSEIYFAEKLKAASLNRRKKWMILKNILKHQRSVPLHSRMGLKSDASSLKSASSFALRARMPTCFLPISRYSVGMKNLQIASNPLVQHHLTLLRDATTAPPQFREQVRRLTLLLLAEAARELPLESIPVETPLTSTAGHRIAGRIALVPVLRAGLGMTDAALEMLPQAEVFHLGMYRNEETFEPVSYYEKLPEHPPETAILLDPMLATGGSAEAALRRIQERGIGRILMLCLIAAPEGVARLEQSFPDIPIYTAALDERLNDKAYIVPGLGDAGDRIFNTF